MKKLIVGISAEGSVVLIEGQLKYFKEKGYETYLLSPYSERVREYCEKEGCTHLRINIRRKVSLISDFFVLLRIIYLFYKYQPDIINLGTPKVSLLGMIAGRIIGIPKRIYTCRGFRFEHEVGFKKRLLIIMEKITARFSHVIICISPSVREFGIKSRLFSENKSVVISHGSSNGFDLKKFSRRSVSNESVSQLKKELGIENKFVYGFVGRIVDRKGINELLEAFARLNNSFSDIILLIVGSIETDQIADKEIITVIKMNKYIKYVGSQRDVPLYLSVMNVFVLPAWWEGFGNVLIQAAAMGVPVISTFSTGTKDAVRNDFNGLLIEPKSIGRLAESMALLYENSELREKLGVNGLEWAKNFDSLSIWRGLDEIYNSVD